MTTSVHARKEVHAMFNRILTEIESITLSDIPIPMTITALELLASHIHSTIALLRLENSETVSSFMSTSTGEN